MVSIFYLVRHGETELSGAKRYVGSMDVSLSEKGAQQVVKSSDFIARHLIDAKTAVLTSYLRDIRDSQDASVASGTATFGRVPESGSQIEETRLAAVYCSDLERAITSGKIISRPHGLSPVIIRDLRERSFGVWEGMSFLEIREKYPKEFELWAEDPVKYSPMGGESTIDVAQRVIPALTEIIERHSGEKVAVVAHGGINRIILCHILGMPLENIFRIEQDCAAVNVVEFWGKYPVVKLLNYRP